MIPHSPTVLLILFLSAVFSSPPLIASPILDPRFLPELPESWFRTAALQANGKVLISFSRWIDRQHSIQSNSVWRLNHDGSRDESFADLDLDGEVISLTLDPQGRIVVSGTFTNLGGRQSKYLARLFQDGSVDMSFSPAIPAQFVPTRMKAAALLDGKVAVAARTLSGRVEVIRLNADGTHDPTFRSVSFEPAELPAAVYGSWIADVIPISEGRLLVGGRFPVPGRTNTFGLARLNANGTLDPDFEAPGVNTGVTSLTLFPNGEVGLVPWLNLQQLADAVLLHSDGTVKQSYKLNVRITAFAALDDTSIIAAVPYGRLNGNYIGLFTFTNGVAEQKQTFGIDWHSHVDLVRAFDGTVLIGGAFRRIGSAGFREQSGLARIILDGEAFDGIRFPKWRYELSEQTNYTEVQIERIGSLEGPLEVRLSTSPETAGDADFAAKQEVITFASGERLKTATLAPRNDLLGERDESFRVYAEWFPPGSNQSERTWSTVVIHDDDAPPQILEIQLLPDGSRKLRVASIPGHEYLIYKSDILRSSNTLWSVGPPIVASTNVVEYIDDSPASAFFYRAARF